MGRTVMPFMHVLQEAFEGWAKFRRTLRKEDQQAFDALFAAAKKHVTAGVYASHPRPWDAIVLAILLEHQKALAALNRSPSGPPASDPASEEADSQAFPAPSAQPSVTLAEPLRARSRHEAAGAVPSTDEMTESENTAISGS